MMKKLFLIVIMLVVLVFVGLLVQDDYNVGFEVFKKCDWVMVVVFFVKYVEVVFDVYQGYQMFGVVLFYLKQVGKVVFYLKKVNEFKFGDLGIMFSFGSVLVQIGKGCEVILVFFKFNEGLFNVQQKKQFYVFKVKVFGGVLLLDMKKFVEFFLQDVQVWFVYGMVVYNDGQIG